MKDVMKLYEIEIPLTKEEQKECAGKIPEQRRFAYTKEVRVLTVNPERILEKYPKAIKVKYLDTIEVL